MAYLDYHPHQTLFHYCSIEAFKGICTTKRLWMSDLSKANDPRELHFGLQQALEAIKLVRHEDLPGAQGLFLSVLWAKIKGFHENIQLFSSCFTPYGDQLPMWRLYTPDGSGVAIGFRPTAVADMHGRVQKVRYLDGDDLDSIKALVRSIAEVFPKVQRTEETELFWIDAVSQAFSMITSTKHRSWSYENEIRLCFSQVLSQEMREAERTVTSLDLDGRAFNWKKPKSRDGRDGPVEYLTMPYGKWRNGKNEPFAAIESVILGPNCEESEDGIRDFLNDQGFSKFKVTRSDCSFR